MRPTCFWGPVWRACALAVALTVGAGCALVDGLTNEGPPDDGDDLGEIGTECLDGLDNDTDGRADCAERNCRETVCTVVFSGPESCNGEDDGEISGFPFPSGLIDENTCPCLTDAGCEGISGNESVPYVCHEAVEVDTDFGGGRCNPNCNEFDWCSQEGFECAPSGRCVPEGSFGCLGPNMERCWAPRSLGYADLEGEPAVGDFDDDGHDDIAIAGMDGIEVVFGNGDGVFSAPVSLSAAPVTRMVAFEGFGRMAIAFVGEAAPMTPSNTVETLLISTERTAMSGPSFDAMNPVRDLLATQILPNSPPNELVVFAVPDEGLVDLRLLGDDGQGGFVAGSGPAFQTALDEILGSAADYDGANGDDIAVYTDVSVVEVFPSEPAAGEPPTPSLVRGPTLSIGVGQNGVLQALDRSNFAVLEACDPCNGVDVFRFFNSAGMEEETFGYMGRAFEAGRPLLVDMDGNGSRDLVATNQIGNGTDNDFYVFPMGMADGLPMPPLQLRYGDTNPPNPGGELAVGDFNEDGAPDIVVGGRGRMLIMMSE